MEIFIQIWEKGKGSRSRILPKWGLLNLLLYIESLIKKQFFTNLNGNNYDGKKYALPDCQKHFQNSVQSICKSLHEQPPYDMVHPPYIRGSSASALFLVDQTHSEEASPEPMTHLFLHSHALKLFCP